MSEGMRILFLSDEPSAGLWDYFEPGKLEGIDMIISCGDLPPQYLSFLATYFKGPILYVHGNHDGCYKSTPPEGCIDIDGKIFKFNGIKIAGLGGSMRYHEGDFQYSENQQKHRLFRLMFKLFFHGGVDIFVAHSPAEGLGDADDLPHRGYKCFYKLFKTYRPKVFAHGHVHLSYSYKQKRLTDYDGIQVVNAFERYVYEYEG